MHQENDQDEKKAYHTPHLIVYGDVRELTETSSGQGMLDGGPNPKYGAPPKTIG